MTFNDIREILETEHDRYTVVERFPGYVDFYLPSGSKNQFKNLRVMVTLNDRCPMAIKYQFFPLPWWKNRFTKIQIKFSEK